MRSRLRGIWLRLRGHQDEDEGAQRFDDEARFHVEMLSARHVERGVPPAEARRRALVEFGGVERFREAAGDEQRSRPFDDLGRDVLRAVRSLARMPAFTIAAVLTLALGIGATTVVYSVVDHVVLRPLPYRDADRLVVIREVIDEIRHEVPTLATRAPHYLAWRDRCEVCDDVAALRAVMSTLHGGAEPMRVRGVRVSANLFGALGVEPEHGRLFLEAEDTPERSSVVLLSHAFWQRHLGGDPRAVGHTIRLGSTEREVVGVLPARFRLPKGDELGRSVGMHADPDFYIPLALSPEELARGGNWDYTTIARLSPGVDVAQAEQHFNALQQGLAAGFPEPLGLSAAVLPLREMVVGGSGRGLLILLGAVGAVLLLVCVNLANLLLARDAGRAREHAVRAALGAGRLRLVREALTESIVLAVIAGIVGVAFAWWGLQLLLHVAPPDMPRLHEVRLDTRVGGIAMLLALATSLFFGALPALRSGRADPGDVLKSGGRTRGGRAESRSRSLLIALQSSMTAVLLVAAGLFLASFVHVLGIDKGFAPQRVLAMDVLIPGTEFETSQELTRIYDRILDEIIATPGLAAAAATSKLPLEGITWLDSFGEVGDVRSVEHRPSGNFHTVTPGYFSTLGIPLHAGRAFTRAEEGADVVVLSRSAYRSLWPGESADAVLGRRVQLGSHFAAEVIGIAADVSANGLEAEHAPILYVPPWTAIGFTNAAAIAVRASIEPSEAIAPARAAIRRAAPGAVISEERSMEQIVAHAAAERRFQVSLLLLFALTALVTACIGIYGVIAHSLARRRGEIGVRMALGAPRSTIHRLVLREGMTATASGLLVGLIIATVAGRILETLLYEVRPAEPAVFAAVAAVLAGAAAAACYLPARRATRAGPSSALRQD